MTEMILGFECPHGFVDHYADCEKVNKPECVKCRDKAKLISETMNGLFVGKWISVKDRLPVNMGTVLIAHRGGVSFGWFNGFYWTKGAATKHRPIKAVTHWMPLPEPPKEG